MSQPSNVGHTTEVIATGDVRRGDLIWAPDDGDWLRVDRMETDAFGDLTVYRVDHSEATFGRRDHILRGHKDRPR
jgi:hypothetical protein